MSRSGRCLRERELPAIVNHRLPGFNFRWAPAAVALMLVLLTIWTGARVWSPSRTAPLQGFSSEEIWSLAQELSADLFLMNEANAEEFWNEVDDNDRLIGASEDEWFFVRGEVEESEMLADLPCPPCLERNRSSRQRLQSSPVSKKFPGYTMELL